jgi:hypothetical protein
VELRINSATLALDNSTKDDPVINKFDTRAATNKLVRLANETQPMEGYSNQAAG